MLNFAAGNPITGYNLTRSLRFRASASAYLTRTPAAAGNRKTFTLSNWVKRGTLGARQSIFDAYAASAGNSLEFQANDTLEFYAWGGASVFDLATTQVFRDPSASYHIVVAVDTTQATAANRIKLYINGSQVTAFGTATYPSLNADLYINNNIVHNIGRRGDAQFYFDGYQAEDNFIDGQALTPTSFGSTNSLTGVWQPARYSGSYGTNGFYLPFTDNSALTTASNVGLGKDFSGNTNYWTTNNISITAGVTYDSMTDVPTLTSATAANFAVLNPVDSATPVLSNGNLNSTSASGWGNRQSTIAMNTGKYYCEFSKATTNAAMFGIILATQFATTSSYIGTAANGYCYYDNGDKYNNNAASAYGATFTTSDIIGVAFDADARTLTFYKNNVSQGVAFSSIPTGAFTFAASTFTSGNINVNFGQQPFTYTPPTGFVALNTYNLPTSTIVKGNTVMDATLYTGTGASLSVTNAASFKPDLVWVKGRSGATDHAWYDSVRGVQKQIESNNTDAETTETTGLTAFGSAGFTVGALAQMNTSAATYVGWQWQAGQGSTSSNTNGTITSTVSVNASAGFSIVTYTGNGTNGATVGHGLGVAPAFFVVKTRGVVGSWQAYHSALTGTTAILLESTGAAFASSAYWNNTNPTSSVFSLGTSSFVNVASQTQVAYCWAAIAGYSAFGSYTGNGSTDGPMIYTGFRPKFVLVKRTDTAGTNWDLYDTARNPYNAMDLELFPNSSSAEYNGSRYFDFLSNGFKPRTSVVDSNASGGTYIYMAFAENPFKNSLAR